jgi:hypothetical protein
MFIEIGSGKALTPYLLDYIKMKKVQKEGAKSYGKKGKNKIKYYNAPNKKNMSSINNVCLIEV